MASGPWDRRLRFIVAGTGLAATTAGILTTISYHSQSGAAALVLGGLLVGLAGVAGGSIRVERAEAAARPPAEQTDGPTGAPTRTNHAGALARVNQASALARMNRAGALA